MALIYLTVRHTEKSHFLKYVLEMLLLAQRKKGQWLSSQRN